MTRDFNTCRRDTRLVRRTAFVRTPCAIVQLLGVRGMVLDPRAIHIRTDGSCFGNPGGESGCAAIVQYPDNLQLPDTQVVDFGCAESGNQRMELMACIKALEWVREHRPWPDVTRVQIVTDSMYVTENVSYRARAWKKNAWRNRYDKPMANDDLWDALLKAHAKVGIHVDFVWQPGKSSPSAKAVDRAAKAAAERGGTDIDRGYRPGAVGRSMVKGGVAQPYPAKGQTDVIRPYAKKIMFKGENRISFNIYDETTQTYASKFYAFASPAMAADLHRGNGWKIQFNSEPQYPQIVVLIGQVFLPKPPSSRSRRKDRGGTDMPTGKEVA